jgi:hypothetical protein
VGAAEHEALAAVAAVPEKLVCVELPAGPLMNGELVLSTAMSGSPTPRMGSTTVVVPMAKGVCATAGRACSPPVPTSATAAPARASMVRPLILMAAS